MATSAQTWRFTTPTTRSAYCSATPVPPRLPASPAVTPARLRAPRQLEEGVCPPAWCEGVRDGQGVGDRKDPSGGHAPPGGRRRAEYREAGAVDSPAPGGGR